MTLKHRWRRWQRRRMWKHIALNRIRQVFKGTHYVDIMIRRNGKWERIQGDFLKDLIR